MTTKLSRAGAYIGLFYVVALFIAIWQTTYMLENFNDHNSLIIRYNVTNHACNLDKFKDYYWRYKKFPDKGLWTKAPVDYLPNFCRFESFALGECLKRKHYNRILIMGDSQGHRYFLSLLKLLKKHSIVCEVIKSENEMITNGNLQAEYYGARNVTLGDSARQIERNCRRCLASHNQCFIQGNTTPLFNLEFVGGTSIKFMKFIFEEYLSEDVDLHVMIPHLNHVGKATVEKEMRNIVKVIKEIHQNNTSLLLVPGASTFPTVANITDYGQNTRMNLKNEYLFHLFQNELLHPETSRVYGFMNLARVSRSRYKWSIDGIHFIDTWYEVIMRSIFSMLCNSY